MYTYIETRILRLFFPFLSLVLFHRPDKDFLCLCRSLLNFSHADLS